LDEEYNLHQAIKMLIQSNIINSCHDCADGGLFVTLMECAFQHNLGFEITSNSSIRKDAFLFGEAQGRIVVSVSASKIDALEKILSNSLVAFSKLGTVSGNSMVIDSENFGNISEYKAMFDHAIGNKM
jgi:phosphoribosylformylglycinamidine synthase